MTALWQITVLLAASAITAMAATTTTESSEYYEPATPPAEEEVDLDSYTPFMGPRSDGFDWLLCRALDKRDPGNMVVSPIGIKLVLAMLYEGATGATAREIMTTLQLPRDRQQMRGNFSSILASLQATRPEYVLDIGTKLYVDERIKTRKLYSEILKTYYNSAIEPINFSDTEAAANKINSWVDAVTNGHVKNLVTDAESMSSKVMMLVNAIFFKGLWRFPFDPEATAPGHFYASPEKSVTASYMKLSHKLYYMEAADIDAKILRLPYQGMKYAMFVVLPNSPTGLKTLATTINPFIMRRSVWLMDNVVVNVTLPKFSFKYATDLKEVLKELGIIELFQNSASLPAIVIGRLGNDRLYVSDVRQKAGLAVDEHGTEAYAATDVSVVNKFGDDAEYVFNAVHPFMFFIEDETTGTVIFIGKVVDPSTLEVATSRPSVVRPPPRHPVSMPPPPPSTARPQPPQTVRPPSLPHQTVRPPAQPHQTVRPQPQYPTVRPLLTSSTRRPVYHRPSSLQPEPEAPRPGTAYRAPTTTSTAEVGGNENVERVQSPGDTISSRAGAGGATNDHSNLSDQPQRSYTREQTLIAWKELFKDRVNN